MPNTVLVGSTGFVGSNLLASHRFSTAYHSTDVQKGFGAQNDLLVYAGVPAAMYLANQDPDADLAVMEAARQNIRALAPKKLVLISSICVYANSKGKTEAEVPTLEGLAPYGANRLQLERWVREDFADALIVRLPALYGLNIKKNFLFDLHTITPALLRPAKYEELAAQSELVKISYVPAGNGFYKLAARANKGALKAFFAANSFNALSFTDSRSLYQFYDLSRLWGDINVALKAGITCLNLATPPVSAAQVYAAYTGKSFCNQLAAEPFDYDMRTLYASLLGGENGYLCSKEEELADICAFLRVWENEE